jgi:hypothetical protein
LFLEQLTRRDISLPAGALRGLIKHCEARNDVYGLLEVLHLGHVEGMHHRNTAQGGLTDNYASDVRGIHEHDDREEHSRDLSPHR